MRPGPTRAWPECADSGISGIQVGALPYVNTQFNRRLLDSQSLNHIYRILLAYPKPRNYISRTLQTFRSIFVLLHVLTLHSPTTLQVRLGLADSTCLGLAWLAYLGWRGLAGLAWLILGYRREAGVGYWGIVAGGYNLV